MDNQDMDDARDETEEFSEEFKCCVCLDLFYKPVVLACGHISCFWCTFKAMNYEQESHCPVCRRSYNHFPSICRLLHFVILKLYPLAYKRRERQVIEEEKKFGTFSPQFEEYLSESHSSKEFNVGSPSIQSTTVSLDKLHLQSSSVGKDGISSVKDSSELDQFDKNYTTTIPTSLSDEAPRNVAFQEKNVLGSNHVDRTCKQLLISDFLCAVCKQLLYHPVVLNCGHVFCEACIINPSNQLCQCLECQSIHPNGFLKVCLVLDHLLEQHLSEEYAARRAALCKLGNCQYGSPLTCSTQAQQSGARCSSLPANDYSGQGRKVHIGVGCDCCGMCPIIGERYKCKDCVETIGFDLCEGCYNSSSKFPGRFNQQHTPEHKFEILQPLIDADLILYLEAEYSEDDGPNNPEDPMDGSPTPDPPRHAQLDPEPGMTAPISANDTSENLDGTEPTS